MFHGRQISDKLNKLHERALTIIHSDTVTSFDNLLIKDKSFTIHHQNIQSLVIEIYKATNLVIILSDFLMFYQIFLSP